MDRVFFRPLLARTTGTRLLRLRVMCGGAELPGLLRKCDLRDKLLALQVLNAVLHLGNLGFVDFERCLYGNIWRRHT